MLHIFRKSLTPTTCNSWTVRKCRSRLTSSCVSHVVIMNYRKLNVWVWSGLQILIKTDQFQKLIVGTQRAWRYHKLTFSLLPFHKRKHDYKLNVLRVCVSNFSSSEIMEYFFTKSGIKVISLEATQISHFKNSYCGNNNMADVRTSETVATLAALNVGTLNYVWK
jgi:hypothetical protein